MMLPCRYCGTYTDAHWPTCPTLVDWRPPQDEGPPVRDVPTGEYL